MERQEKLNYYILFETYTQGMVLYDLLREEKIPARISPAPRVLQKEVGCGMSLLLQPEDVERARACISRHQAAYHSIAALPCQIRPKRDRFC
ncbi:MAG: DUF3343 domain-containing protein [Lachnospiraceae bacterium]|jgi:hypothetical protein|nr:DUF3343 domain-containing protein [Lachnospiraceae bacterium]MCI1657637.1 DUF3343 domain-containing protein [Lachnospiraceae bacterium]MCI2196052.1 DUF3343 domain-containing protein [Lachnospiraceae bacterium]